MADEWFYWHEADVLGPFSGQQLVALAAAGDILPDDIVWREGVERGVPAHKVQHLFAEPSPVAAATTPAEAAPAAPVPEPVKPSWDGGRASTSGRGRATAGKGTIIVGQDGKNVKFRMKCTTCNTEDSSWQTMAIARGTTRRTYYCKKCRKRCSVEIHCVIG